MSEKSVSLFYKDGKSDKVYHCQVEKKLDGYVVNFQYGRRGSTLQTGCKTPVPVDLNKAEEIWGKLVTEKTSKGYTLDQSGTLYQGTDKAGQVSGLVPQLLNPIDEARAQELIEDDDWFMQEKMDGFHQMVRISDVVTISNRKGLVVPGSDKVISGLKQLIQFGQPVLDGESIGDVYHPFDVLELEGKSLREKGAWDRYLILRGLLEATASPYLTGVRTEASTTSKQVLFDQIKEERGEGIVFKKKDAPYVSGRPNSGGNMLKFKFKASATCEVLVQNGDKRSVSVAVLDPDEKTGANLRCVGNVTIPVNYTIPKQREIIEVEYLYAFPNGGSLFQPVYKGLRPDKSEADLYNSLKFKQGTEEDS